MAIHRDHKHGERLLLVACGSLAANGLLWYGLSRGADQIAVQNALPELVVDRVVVEKPNPKENKRAIVKPIPPKHVPKPPPPLSHMKPPVIVKASPTPPPPQSPAQGAHNHVLVVKPSPKAQQNPSTFHALAGGQAKVGAPTSGQNSGDATSNPPHPSFVVTPVTPPIQAAPVAKPQPPTPKHEDTPPSPPPVAEPKHTDPPPPPPPPKPKGPTQDAAPSHQINPEIPENLKSQTFKSFVRVKVSISADGSFEVILRTSSGNSDIDKLVLDALNKWKWRAALKNGDAVDSVQLFRFDFSVN